MGNNAIIRAGSVVVNVSINKLSDKTKTNNKQDIAPDVITHGNPAFG
jgi:acetyltransferase-like isoleucine patch superfamily enzyme